MADSDDLVLLTGISGFIAKHIAVALLHAGYRVRGTVRSLSRTAEIHKALSGTGADLSRLDLVEADLDRDDGWTKAAAGARFVQHTASPFPRGMPRDRFGLVATAKGGTLRVLDAAERAGAERLVLTSSVAAVYYGHEGRLDPRFTEADFSNVESRSISAYAISKTLAEQAAWDALAGARMEMATINPALVLGPLLDARPGTSVRLIGMMMRGRMPLVPNISIGIVDVRDVAAAHLAAMTIPEAADRRFLLSAGSRSLREIGAALGRSMPAYARRMPKATMPDILVRAAALVMPEAVSAVPELGSVKVVDTAPAHDLLGLRFRAPEDAILASGMGLERFGLV